MTYTKLDFDGTETPVVLTNNRKPTLEEMQAIVGGLIERVSIKGGEMWVNEEGLLNGLPFNLQASSLAKHSLGSDAYIVGDVLVCRRKKRDKKVR